MSSPDARHPDLLAALEAAGLRDPIGVAAAVDELRVVAAPAPDALRVLLDLDGESAANVLGISVTNCNTRLSRALKRLEERMSADVAA